MSEVGDLLAFAGVMILGQFSPGPDMLLLTRTALKLGARTGVEMALGIACGLTVHATLAVAGLGVMFDRYPMLWQGLRWLAAGYLLWLAFRIGLETFRTKPPGSEVEPDISPGRRPFFRGLFCNLSNPKAAIFLAAVIVPFSQGDRPAWWPFAIFGVVVGQAFLLWALWAWMLQWRPLQRIYGQAERWIDGVFSVTLAVLAIKVMVG
jgi:threonine/homoserine/homoserine lactone efflux protein